MQSLRLKIGAVILASTLVVSSHFARVSEAALPTAAEALTSPRAQLHVAAADASHGIVLGNPDGDVTLVEFFDYNCDYCRDIAKHVRDLLAADPNLRIVLRSYPLHGTESRESAQITWAVSRMAGPTQAFEFHTRLMASRGTADRTRALELAAEMRLDAERLSKLMNDETGRASAEHNLRLAHKLQLTGTPAFVVGGEVVLGAVGATRLRAVIANVRKCGSTECSSADSASPDPRAKRPDDAARKSK